MKLFIINLIKFSLVGLIPLLIITIGYFYYDPFKVMKTYNDFSYPYVVTNRDYISTEVFLKNRNKQNYNSFIFGSSRTLAFKPTSWKKFLPLDAKPYVFEASGESIYGIYKKIKFLDSLNVKIDNAFIILCRDVSFANESNHSGHLFVKHPKISGEGNLDFQLKFYKAYLNSKFLFCFYSYKFTGKYKNYMEGYIEHRKIKFDTITNEINIIDQENEITQNQTQYYSKRIDLFYKRHGEKTDDVKRINQKKLFMLKEVKRILEKNKTNYKIVLSPLYEQIKFNNLDLYILKNLFSNNLYDFTGKNIFTDFKENYYEQSHFRPNVGDSIFKIIYKTNQ